MAEKKSKHELSKKLSELDKKFRKKVLEGKLKGAELEKAKTAREKAVSAMKSRSLEKKPDSQIVKEVTDKIKTKEEIGRFKGTDKIKTKKTEKVKTGKEFKEKISKLQKLKKFGKIASKGLKAIPGLGTLIGLGTAIGTGDVKAATPLGSVEDIGIKKAFEDPSSPEFKARIAKLKRKHELMKKKKK